MKRSDCQYLYDQEWITEFILVYGGGNVTPTGDWILTTGFWEDANVWRDDDVWID